MWVKILVKTAFFWFVPIYSVQDCLREKNVRLYLELKVTDYFKGSEALEPDSNDS